MQHDIPKPDSETTAAGGGTRILLTSVGTGPYRRVTYQWQGDSRTTELAPVAVCALVKPRPRLVGVLVTDAARAAQFDQLAGQLRDIGVEVEPIGVPEGRDEAELQQIVERLTGFVVGRAGPDDAVALDVTLALRHLPFVYLAALSYLGALHDVRIDGVYYAALDLGAGGTAPILDVTPLVALAEWHSALRAARGWGDFRPLAERLRVDMGRLFKLAHGDPSAGRAAHWAQRLARASASALPLEAGVEAAGFHAALRQLGPVTSPLAGTARQALEALARETAHVPVAGGRAQAGKRAITLDIAELGRELALAERYVRAQSVPAALLVLREWLVNLVLALDGPASAWLDHGARERAEGRLSGLERRVALGLASDDESTVGEIWQKLRGDRNAYAHAGFREADVDVSDERLRQHIAACRALLERLPRLDLSAGGECVLVTPLGRSRGVLFSAVIHAQPARAVIVTSAEGCRGVDEALERAGAPGLPHDIIEMRDPYDGFAEFRAAAATPGLLALFASAGTVVVNVTGGTTAMSHVVERLGDEARRLGTAVRRIALIDRRPADEQQRDPYVLGEVVDLEA